MIRTRLEQYITETGCTQAYVAKGIGVSDAMISTYRKGKYTGDVEGVERSITAWLDREADKQSERKGKLTLTYLPTLSPAKLAREIANITAMDGEIGVLTGAPGTGKTSSMRAYTSENPSTVMIEVTQTYNKRVLLQEMADKLNLKYGEKLSDSHLHEAEVAICDKLRGSGRLVIIDEAEYLSVTLLELIRRIYDHTEDENGNKCGILLVGLPRLRANLVGKRGEYAQIHSRVGLYKELKALDVAGVRQIVESATGTGKNAQKYYASTNGNIRRLSKLLARVNRVATLNGINVADVDEELISGAVSTLIL
jgi:DNA transposition AAA+ family ATPase